mmetsp:Transcript_18313/g.20863  ORF Transcript_18313/g.20863 Transcript_18313/m.20863 type:complete len:112 (-) Transcript_18313:66-401(-)
MKREMKEALDEVDELLRCFGTTDDVAESFGLHRHNDISKTFVESLQKLKDETQFLSNNCIKYWINCRLFVCLLLLQRNGPYIGLFVSYRNISLMSQSTLKYLALYVIPIWS